MIFYKYIWFHLVLLLFMTEYVTTWEMPSFEDIFRFHRKTEQTKVNLKTRLMQNDCDLNRAVKLPCDENRLVYQLARLYIVSPERIILLLTDKSLRTTCRDVGYTLHNINNTLVDCLPLPQNNLYKKLYDGLIYFNNHICHAYPLPRGGNLIDYHDCLQQLREDLIDCEGPPDWFEKTNKNIVCQYLNDVLDCNYIKAAMLCSIKPALMLRNFSYEILKSVVPFNCKVSDTAPHVEDPMPASLCAQSPQIYSISFISFLAVIITNINFTFYFNI